MTTRRRHAPNFAGKEERNGVNHYNQADGFSSTEISLDKLSLSTSDDMSVGRDRTSEFMSAVQTLQSRNAAIVNYNSQRKEAPRMKSQFMYVARKIGNDLANTFAKLEKLTILAKRKSIFDDKPVEIQELTYIIRQDITTLNNQIGQLQQLVAAERGHNSNHMQTHSNAVVVGLQSKLASMSGDFKTVLEVRTQNLKDQKNRREHFSQSSVGSDGMVGANSGSVLLNDEQSSSGDYSINMDLTERERYTRQLQLIDEQDSYIQDRADTMQNIEQTIVELGGIFQQLAHMVKEQEEMVQRIDSNVEDTQLNVEAAHGEILKYFQSVTSNRWLMIKVFGILIVFFIIFVVFLA